MSDKLDGQLEFDLDTGEIVETSNDDSNDSSDES
jgi:hypothetical protein